MSAETTAPRGAAAPVVDLTPAMVGNWTMEMPSPAVLIVHPDASLHQRCALAWSMSWEIHAIAASTASCKDAQDLVFLMPALTERMRQLMVLLHGICAATAAGERGRS